MAKVLSIVSYTFLPAHTGGQRGIALFNKYYAEQVELHCVTTLANRNELADYTCYPLFSGSKFRYINVFNFFTLKKYIKKHGITHVQLEHPYLGWLGVWLKYACGVKLIVHSHNIESLRWKNLGKWWWKILWRYERFVHRKADSNFFITDEDRMYAEKQYGLRSDRCITVTYGIEQNKAPDKAERSAARQQLVTLYKLDASATILFFNGAFNYWPNKEGLLRIIDSIDPLLKQEKEFKYNIIICGKDIPEELSRQRLANLHFAGFVDDIGLYFKGADVFLNPITDGGGIKTKLVEALGYGLNAVSTRNGAIGVNEEICNGKLFVVNDSDWDAFVKNILKAAREEKEIGDPYFRHFNWREIARAAAAHI